MVALDVSKMPYQSVEEFMRILFIVLTLMGFSLSTYAGPPLAVSGMIKTIRTGWNVEAFGIEMNEPMQNPANCPLPDGYIADSSQPGYKTYYAAALTAFVDRARI